MGKKAILALVLASILAFFLSPGCRKKEKETGGSSPAGQGPASGELHILNVSPKGQTAAPDESEMLVVIFDQPMVPLERLAEGKGSSFLVMEPAFSGKHRWLGTKTLAFIPDARFPYASEIKVTVPAGTRSSNGFALNNAYSWTFQTILPRLVKHFPQDTQKGLRLDSQVLLVFNQPILKSKAGDFISLSSLGRDGKRESLDFTLDFPSAQKLEEVEIRVSPEMTLLLKPNELFRPDYSYLVELKTGLPAKEGRLGLEKNAGFSFATFRTFAFLGLESEANYSPSEPLKFQFSNGVNYKDFVQKVHFDPEIAIPDHYSEWDYGGETLWLNLPLHPETEYSVKIDEDLVDQYGNKLGKEARLKFQTSAFPASASMTTGHGIVEAYGELRYPVHVVNATELFFQARRVGKEEVIPLLLTPKIFWSSEQITPQPAFFQQERLLRLNLPRNKRQIVPLELKDFLANGLGFVFFQLDTRSEEKWERFPKAFLQVTNLGISAKFSPENNTIWVTDLKTGMPVAGAAIEVRDDGNIVRWQGKTDGLGIASSPGWKILGLHARDAYNKPEQWVFASRGPDTAFIYSEWGTGIDPYRFGIAYDWDPQPLRIQGSIFTERGIYRAGERVQIKGIIRKREKGQWQLPRVKEVECEILDPFQKSVVKTKLALDAFGSFDFKIDTLADAALGYYQIAVKVPPETPTEKEVILNESFRLEAFRPAEFEVHLRSLQDHFVFGEAYRAEIGANYLFGGAMSGQKVSWRLRFNPADYSPPGHKGYVFGNEIDWTAEEAGTEGSRLVSSADSTLGPDGRLEVKIPLVPEKEKDSVFAALEATVQSPSRRSISSRIQTVVHRGDFYLGLKPSTSFLKGGEKLTVAVLAVAQDGTPLAKKNVLLKLIRREWHSVRKASVGGAYRWLTQKEDAEVAHLELQSSENPVEAAFEPEKSGFYFLLAESLDSRGNKVTTSTYLYVTGKDYVPWERRDDDTVELVADSEDYRPGDVAKILVKSPYERAKALVTIEREFILESKVLEVAGSSSQIEIPIGADYLPNVFVSVLLVQGRSSRSQAGEETDVGKPSFKIGYVKLNVNPIERQLRLDLEVDKRTHRPRDQVTLKLNVKDFKNVPVRASVTLAVVDVGVLNLIGYQTPNPFAQFYGQSPLSVQTSESRLHVVGQRKYGEKGEEVGGSGDQSMMAPASLAEVQLRGDFRSTAYWEASLLTDDHGAASVTFALPDNLTTFRIMAVAQTQASQFGQAETTFRVTKPLLLQASLPRFARVGDTFEGGTVVHNFSEKAGSISVQVEAKEIALRDGERTRRFTLEPGRSKEVLFSFAAQKAGTALLSFRALMGEESDGLEISLPLKAPRPAETVALMGQTNTSAEERVAIPEAVHPDLGRLEVQAAASAITGLKGCLDYLADYPYLCLEQRLSASLPFLVASDIILDFKLSPFDKGEIEKQVRRTLKEAYGCQKDDGGFGLWPDSPSSSPYISCYAVFALAEAKRAGYEIDKGRMEQAAAYLKKFLREAPRANVYPLNLQNWKTAQAFALYDLALLGQSEPAYSEKLYTERAGLSLFGQTLLLKALHLGKGPLPAQNTLVQELVNKVKVTPTGAHFEDQESSQSDWIYSSNIRTTSAVLQALLEVGSDFPLLPQAGAWLVEKRKAGRWSSTQENFYVFYALNEYYRSAEKTKPDFKVTIALGERSMLAETFTKPDQPMARSESPLIGFKSGAVLPLRINKEGKGTVFYGARMTYVPNQKLQPRDEGMALLKKVESLDGKPLESVRSGSLVAVTIQVIVPRESLFVVVEDPLPAGFEAVNPSFATESQEQQRILEELDQEKDTLLWQGFNHIEMHDDRVLLFADSLRAGVHTHRYLARALTFGLFQTPGTKVEEMYAPEVFARTPEAIFKIVK